MQIKPEERAKAFVLVIGTVLALAFAAKTVLGAKQPAPAPSPASTTASRPVAGTPAATSAARVPASAQQAQAVADLYTAETGTVPAMRDPFKPPVTVFAAPVKKAAPVLPTKLPPAIVKPPSLPAVALKGVIDGDPPIAVFESSAGTQYVKKGEPLAPGTQLAHISEAGVVLRFRGKDIALMVGHSIAPIENTADGLNVRPVLPAPAPGPGRSLERATITSAPPSAQSSGTGITEISQSEVQLPGKVPFQIASVNIPAAPSIDVSGPATPQPEKRTTTVRQTGSTVSRHRVRRHKHRRHRKHGRHHRHRHRHAAHQQAHSSPAPQAPAAHN